MKVPADETSLKATGAGAPTASAGPSAKTATSGFSAPQVPSQTATGGVKNVSPEGVQEPAVAVSGDAAAVKGKMGPALQKVSGETAPVPVAADAAENNPLAETQLKQISAPLTKGAVNDSISGQMTLPTPPTANSQETTGLSVKPSAGVTAALEEASEGRVAQIGSDKQSGQTGLFHGSHNPPGTVQASGAVTSSDAAVHPFEHELLKQITGKTVFYLKNGKSEARIDLKPELLGHMRLHVSTDNGQVTLKIMTKSAWVRDIIESSINHLKNELHSHNLQIDRLDVSVSGESRDFANENSQTADSQLASSNSALTGEDEPMTSDGEASQNPLEPNARVGLVDYFA